MTQVQARLNRIEQCADQTASAMRKSTSQTREGLRHCIEDMHAQAREVRELAQLSTDQNQLTGRIDRLEEIGDPAKRAGLKRAAVGRSAVAVSDAGA